MEVDFATKIVRVTEHRVVVALVVGCQSNFSSKQAGFGFLRDLSQLEYATKSEE